MFVHIMFKCSFRRMTKTSRNILHAPSRPRDVLVKCSPALDDLSVLTIRRRGILSPGILSVPRRVECRNCIRLKRLLARLLWYTVNLSSVYIRHSVAEIKDDIATTVDFDDVLKFCVGDDGHSVWCGSAKFHIKSHTSLFRQVEMFVVTEDERNTTPPRHSANYMNIGVVNE